MELEHERMIENKVWEPIDKNKIPSKAKGLMSTWAMKRKANSKFHAQIKNACKINMSMVYTMQVNILLHWLQVIQQSN
jgi:spermidine/putrescine-binding protein